MTTRLLLAALVLSGVGCGRKAAPTASVTGSGPVASSIKPIDENEYASATFSSTDPRQALLWMAARYRPVLAVQFIRNDAAEVKERGKFTTALRTAVGVRIKWPCLVDAVHGGNGQDYYLGVQRFCAPFTPDGATERDEELPSNLFPVWMLAVQGMKVADHDWAASLRRGDAVTVEGVVKEIIGEGGGPLGPAKLNRGAYGWAIRLEDGYSVRRPN